MARLRSTLREYFPAALLAFEDLDAPAALELLGRAPDPDQAARLTKTVIVAALTRARRRRVEDRTRQPRTIFGAPESPAMVVDLVPRLELFIFVIRYTCGDRGADPEVGR